MAKIKRHDLTLGITLLATLLRVVAAQQEEHSDVQHSKHGSGLVTRCDHPGTGGYFITKDTHSYSGAADACSAKGGYLADLSHVNFLLATDMVISCAGPNQKAWIR